MAKEGEQPPPELIDRAQPLRKVFSSKAPQPQGKEVVGVGVEEEVGTGEREGLQG